MSRHGYVEGCDDDAASQWALIRAWGAVKSAINGRRGQAFLRELRDALDAMPEKRLIAESLVDQEGERCAMGVVAKARGLDVSNVDPEEPEQVAAVFGVSKALVREIAYENDDNWADTTPEQRWKHMRWWVDSKIKVEAK